MSVVAPIGVWPPAAVCDAVIDVSHWQGEIDWGAVAAAGIRFALIKATQGTAVVDPRFRINRAGARKAGIAAAPYHFVTGDDPAAQAALFRATTGLEPGAAFMLDWEEAGRATADDFVALGQILAEAAGRDPLAYYGRFQLAAAHPVVGRWPLMLPEYPGGGGAYAATVRHPPPAPPGRPAARPFDFHQYTQTGRVPGIAGAVDRSAWIGTADELDRWIATGALPAGASVAADP